jgi:hypothetical protein
VRHSEHEVARANVTSTQGKLNRIRPACAADGVINPDEIGKGGFERLDLSAKDIAPAL